MVGTCSAALMVAAANLFLVGIGGCSCSAAVGWGCRVGTAAGFAESAGKVVVGNEVAGFLHKVRMVVVHPTVDMVVPGDCSETDLVVVGVGVLDSALLGGLAAARRPGCSILQLPLQASHSLAVLFLFARLFGVVDV